MRCRTRAAVLRGWSSPCSGSLPSSEADSETGMPTTEISIAAGAAPISGSFDDTLDISFFVPCYNEEPNILGAIEKLVGISTKLGLSYEILVFDDCSRDRTV